MKAFIMAAGFGTRLQPLTIAVPKPLVTIAGKPIMQLNLEHLAKAGVKDITANIHYHPEQIQNYFGNGSDFGVNLTYSFEVDLLGTAGGVKRMAEEIQEVKGTFLVLSSDALSDINLAKLVAFHKRKKALVTMALCPVADVTHFGVVVTDQNQRITAFQEKPKKEEALSNFANSGIYVMEAEVLKLIPQSKKYDFGSQLFPEMIKRGMPLFGYPMIEYWNDVGSLDQYYRSNVDAINGRVQIQLPGRKAGKDLWLGRGSRIHSSAEFKGSLLLGERTNVGKNVKINGNCVIGDMCIVEDGAQITDSIIWSHTYVGRGCRIRGALLGGWCHLDTQVVLGEKVVVGNRTIIGAKKRILAHTHILPDSNL